MIFSKTTKNILKNLLIWHGAEQTIYKPQYANVTETLQELDEKFNNTLNSTKELKDQSFNSFGHVVDELKETVEHTCEIGKKNAGFSRH